VRFGVATEFSWKVSDTFMGSDNTEIIFSIKARNSPSRVPKNVTGYKTETLDMEMV